MRKFLLALSLMLPLCGGIQSCILTPDGGGFETIENMTEVQFNRWILGLQLTTLLSARTAINNNWTTQEDLNVAASVIDAIKDQPIILVTEQAFREYLMSIGLTNMEATAIVMLIRNELVNAGILSFMDETTGQLLLTPRTEQILTLLADALRNATVIQQTQVNEMEATLSSL